MNITNKQLIRSRHVVPRLSPRCYSPKLVPRTIRWGSGTALGLQGVSEVNFRGNMEILLRNVPEGEEGGIEFKTTTPPSPRYDTEAGAYSPRELENSAPIRVTGKNSTTRKSMTPCRAQDGASRNDQKCRVSI